MPYKVSPLPLAIELETRAVLKKVTAARSALAELKGSVAGIPNETILINTLSLQEAKDSSAIENIITTQDELYQFDTFGAKFKKIQGKSWISPCNSGMRI